MEIFDSSKCAIDKKRQLKWSSILQSKFVNFNNFMTWNIAHDQVKYYIKCDVSLQSSKTGHRDQTNNSGFSRYDTRYQIEIGSTLEPLTFRQSNISEYFHFS